MAATVERPRVSTGEDVGHAGRHRSMPASAWQWLGPLVFGCGMMSLAPLPPAVRGVLLAAFVLIGPGMAVVTLVTLPLPAIIAVVPIVGMAVVAGTTTMLAWLHLWAPTQLVAALLVVVGGLLLRDARSLPLPVLRRPTAVTARHLRARSVVVGGAIRANPALMLLTVAVVTWSLTLSGLRAVPYSQFGLLFVGTGPLLVACTLAVVVAFGIALRQDRLRTAALTLGAAIVVQRLTVTLVTDVPIYGWLYKHLGVIDYVQRTHELPAAPDIYGQWPGFFTAFAWFGDVAGVGSIEVAHVFTPLVHVLIAVEVFAIARLIGHDSRTALTAAMFAELVNWVGQDYFAPQAIAFVMALGIFALLITSRSRPAAGYLSIPLFATLVPLHQLTPYWVCGVAIVLGVTKRLRPRLLPIPFMALLLAYLVPRIPIIAPYGILSGFNPLANANSNVEFDGTFGKVFTSVTCRSLSAGVILLAAVCAVVWWRRGKPSLIAAVLAFSSFALLFGQSYGGEAIFRVYLYAVPGCAILIAPLVVKAVTMQGPRRLLNQSVFTGAVTLGCVATAAGLQGYYGLWSLVTQYRSQVTMGNELMASETAPVRIFSLYPVGLPTRASSDYVRFAQRDKDFDQTILGVAPSLKQDYLSAGQFVQLTRAAASFAGNTYVVVDRQAVRALEYYGISGPNAVADFVDRMGRSPYWTLHERDDVTTIFAFNRAGLQ